MSMNPQHLKNVLEAALFSAGQPLTVDRLLGLFTEEDMPEREQIRDVLGEIQENWSDRGIELIQVSSGYRFQVRQELAPWISRIEEERPTRYSRALLETLALIVYRQPITRAEIEDVRGVSVSTSIIKTLMEREWIRVVGHRDVPGKPALYGSTKTFLDDFSLKSLSELPPLAEMRSIDSIQEEFELNISSDQPANDGELPAHEPESDADIAASFETVHEHLQDELVEDEAGLSVSNG